MSPNGNEYIITGVHISDGGTPYRFIIPFKLNNLFLNPNGSMQSISYSNKDIGQLLKKSVKDYFQNEEINITEL
jgi:hypothetical protein